MHAGRLVPVYSTDRGAGPARAARAHARGWWRARAGQVAEVLPEAVRHRRGLVALGEALRGAHFPRDRGGADGSPPSARLRRLPVPPARPGDPPRPHHAGARHRLSRRPAAGGPAARLAALHADRRSGARVGRDPHGHGRAVSHAPPAAGRRRLRQDHRGGAGRADRDRGRLPGGRHGADRDPGRAALHDLPAPAGAAGRAGRAADLVR